MQIIRLQVQPMPSHNPSLQLLHFFHYKSSTSIILWPYIVKMSQLLCHKSCIWIESCCPTYTPGHLLSLGIVLTCLSWMFCVKFHVFNNDQVCTYWIPHGKSCGASAAALRGEYSLLCCAMLMAKTLFQVSHYTQ